LGYRELRIGAKLEEGGPDDHPLEIDACLSSRTEITSQKHAGSSGSRNSQEQRGRVSIQLIIIIRLLNVRVSEVGK